MGGSSETIRAVEGGAVGQVVIGVHQDTIYVELDFAGALAAGHPNVVPFTRRQGRTHCLANTSRVALMHQADAVDGNIVVFGTETEHYVVVPATLIVGEEIRGTPITVIHPRFHRPFGQ